MLGFLWASTLLADTADVKDSFNHPMTDARGKAGASRWEDGDKDLAEGYYSWLDDRDGGRTASMVVRHHGRRRQKAATD